MGSEMCIRDRVVVVESMAAICAFDMLLESMTSKMYTAYGYVWIQKPMKTL